MRQMIKENPITAIMRNVPMEQAVDYATAIVNGGVTSIEVALNTPNAFEQISLIKKHLGDSIHVGAGTAITSELAKKALDAGAEFLLTPSINDDILSYCSKNKVKLLPGVMTPSDVNACLIYGFDTLKLFPASCLPANYVKSLKGPLDNTDYVAVGGVSPSNILEFFKQGFIGVGIGSNLIPKECVKNNDWDGAAKAVAELHQSVVEFMKG